MIVRKKLNRLVFLKLIDRLTRTTCLPIHGMKFCWFLLNWPNFDPSIASINSMESSLMPILFKQLHDLPLPEYLIRFSHYLAVNLPSWFLNRLLSIPEMPTGPSTAQQIQQELDLCMWKKGKTKPHSPPKKRRIRKESAAVLITRYNRHHKLININCIKAALYSYEL